MMANSIPKREGIFINKAFKDDEEDEHSIHSEHSDSLDSVQSQHSDDNCSRTAASGFEDARSRQVDFDSESAAQDYELWDVFEETPWENWAHADRHFWTQVNKVSRVLLITFLFFFILALSSISSIAFLIISYNMNATRHNYTLPGGHLQKPGSEDIRAEWIWAAMILITAPYIFTFISCILKLCVKKTRSLRWQPLLMALFVETIHSVGLGIFVFVVTPAYDPLVVIALTQGVVIIPAALKVYRVKRLENSKDQETYFSWLNSAVLLLAVAFAAIQTYKLHKDSLALTALTPVSLLLLSIEWWQNFIPVKEQWKAARRARGRKLRKERRKGKHSDPQQQAFEEEGSVLFRVKYSIRDRRTKIEAVCAVWKILLNLLIPLTVVAAPHLQADCASALFFMKDSADDCTLWKHRLVSSPGEKWCRSDFPFIVAVVGAVTSGAAYKAAKVSCKIKAQKLCFAAPLLLSTPLTFLAVVLFNGQSFRLMDCSFRWPSLPEGYTTLTFLEEYVKEYWLPIAFLGYLAIVITTAHVWTPSAERVASTDKLFVMPLYCNVLFAQSLLLNRAIDDKDTSESHLTMPSNNSSSWSNRLESLDIESVDQEMRGSRFPRIYACATMWHENPTEMTQLLKSLFRMDQDQFTRACLWKRFNVIDEDFYHYEAHIIFDDAFEKKPKKTGEIYTVVNSYVKNLVDCVYEAASSVYPANVLISAPEKMETPYGGRLTFQLPGGNPLVIHLKNKENIRLKKRWSQVMYMYYLLSYKLLLGKAQGSRKQLADNTFLLVLDGDVDFFPDSVQLLVDRMKRNHHVGAACGRIHPTGSGLMAWYQKFEYAVSHWLQKASEHVFGCVLCSPGCFSLFRASALMEDNVLRRYTKVATSGRHAVQYDMGEDRWLCTLLLQQGKRVEYAAAADALTFCPDDFGEFYSQRRRWTPSTMANILDLLSDWRHVTKVNGSISLLFIGYQLFLFVSSVLTPGTIFLLILGAINTAYPTMPLYGALLLNLLPIVIFIVLCFCAPKNVQINFATLLSIVYSLVMMVVLVGLIRQITASGMCSITAIFFVGVASIFCLSAILHPQEIFNLLYGLLYFLAIPSMSMLLIFYAVANINEVSWGTRDTNKDAKAKPENNSQRLAGGLKRIMGTIDGTGAMVNSDRTEDAHTSDYNFSFGNLFRCICCPRRKENDGIVERLEDIESALHELRRAVRDEKDDSEVEFILSANAQHPGANASQKQLSFQFNDAQKSNPLFQNDDIQSETGSMTGAWEEQAWWEDSRLTTGRKVDLDLDEERFWEQLIDKYLLPLEQDPDFKTKSQAITTDLNMLRNKVALLFFLSNALFVTIIFILETVAEYSPGLTIRLPCDRGFAGQKIEPISGAFTVIFGILLVLQMFGMLMHRFSTFVHIVAATSIRTRHTAAATDNFDMFGRNEWRDEFYDMTVDIMRHSQGFVRESVTTSESGLTSGQDTASNASSREHIDIVRELFRRQKERRKSVKRQNLEEIMDDRLPSVIKEIDKIAASQDKGAEESVVEPDADKDDSAKPAAVPTSLLWMRARSVKAVKALSGDPERRRLASQTKWKRAADKIRKTAATAVQDTDKNNFPAVVRAVQAEIRNKKKNAEEVSDNKDNDKRGTATGETVQDASAVTVNEENPPRSPPSPKPNKSTEESTTGKERRIKGLLKRHNALVSSNTARAPDSQRASVPKISASDASDTRL